MPYAQRMPRWKKSRARAMRANPTPGERRLWRELRGSRAVRGRILGVAFRRQVPMLGYIADFYAPKARLVLEVDGPSHAGRERWDGARDAAMRERRLEVLRVTEEEVRVDLAGVCDRIRSMLTLRLEQMAQHRVTRG